MSGVGQLFCLEHVLLLLVVVHLVVQAGSLPVMPSRVDSCNKYIMFVVFCNTQLTSILICVYSHHSSVFLQSAMLSSCRWASLKRRIEDLRKSITFRVRGGLFRSIFSCINLAMPSIKRPITTMRFRKWMFRRDSLRSHPCHGGFTMVARLGQWGFVGHSPRHMPVISSVCHIATFGRYDAWLTTVHLSYQPA
jgi:hypothetical protein